MKRNLRVEVRALLRANPDGLTIAAMMDKLGAANNALRYALGAMPDVYIDRWVKSSNFGRHASVWVAVEVPEHCPPPDRQTKKEWTKVNRRARMNNYYRNKAGAEMAA